MQGAGSRLAFSYARDGALPGSKWISEVSQRFKTPANALFGGALVTVVFIGLAFAAPTHDVKIWFITYPANTNVLVSLVSFSVSGIYLSFLLTVIGSMIARARGWVPAGKFTMGRWAWPVSVVAGLYLILMLINVVLPSGLSSGRAYFNLDWITLLVMAVVTVAGIIVYFAVHGGREIGAHIVDTDAPGTEAESVASQTRRDVPLTGGRDRIAVRGNVKRCPATSRASGRSAAPSCGCLAPDPPIRGISPFRANP